MRKVITKDKQHSIALHGGKHVRKLLRDSMHDNYVLLHTWVSLQAAAFAACEIDYWVMAPGALLGFA